MKRILWALLLALITSCFTVIATSSTPSFAAQGDSLWSRLLHDGYRTGGTGVLSHGDSTVTATSCGSYSSEQRVATFNTSNDVVNQSHGSPVGPAMCSGKGVTGIDNTVFYTGTTGQGSSAHTAIFMERQGVVVAIRDFAHSCSNWRYATPFGMAIGADGNLYAIVSNGQQCSVPDQLVSVDGLTGAVRFAQNLTAKSVQNSETNLIRTHNNGVVVLEEDVDSSGHDLLSYFDYAGSKNTLLSCAINDATDSCGFASMNNENSLSMYVNENGVTFLELSHYAGSGQPCGAGVRRLRYDTSAQPSTVTPATCPVSLVGIGEDEALFFAMPTGSGNTVVATDNQGQSLYSGNVFDKPGYTVINAYPRLIDGTSHFVTARVARYGSSQDKHLYVDRLNSNGTWTTLFSTEQFADPNATDNFSYKSAAGLPYVAFAKNALYVAVCSTACSNGQESTRLYRVDSPGMDIEYPRSEIFAEYKANHGEPLNYVALGDSFSSGEGVPPFINGTDVSGTNMCHRSSSAYPMLLDQDPNINLNLQSFRACSGATTQTMVSGQWSNGNQLSSLNEDTDVVTITVGGNDVGFRDFAVACTVSLCNFSTSEYSTIVSKIDNDLPGLLEDVYDGIAANISSTTEVYVVGYPHIAPSSMPTGPSSACWPLNGQMDDPDPALNDGATVRDVITRLNSAVADAVSDTNDSRFKYVDPNVAGSPFIGHDWCMEDGYFNIVTYNDVEHSFHPNLAGHGAYGSVIKDVLD